MLQWDSQKKKNDELKPKTQTCIALYNSPQHQQPTSVTIFTNYKTLQNLDGCRSMAKGQAAGTVHTLPSIS